MAPNNTKASYKSYESQARMIRAIVAAHPEVKWNYKEIVACYGSDMTEHALNHRFRRLRAQAAIIREARSQGFDSKDMVVSDHLPTTQDAIDKNNIAKYFGQSTPDGIQFQFRSIKRDAEHLRKTEAEGGQVATCLTGSPAASTPSRATPSRRSATTASGGRKRGRRAAVKHVSSDDDDDDDDDDEDVAADDDDDDDDEDDKGFNWDARDVTPSKRRKPAAATPAQKSAVPRRAAQNARATIANVAAQLRDSCSPSPKAKVLEHDAGVTRSLFGPYGTAPQFVAGTSFADMDHGGYGDGEI
ncbi:hypothetical protein XA68_18311 [Ophiocordyceps unilateralis]|uniref:Uncharacterized protein n=1 Tax=Ophiocordyceps unilateralis TaxID=268505 RepID=A0A2A9P272_OPHUN|nr:hypothetical protein XA68_18311 [Ophiocordyceps unilateralis]